MFTLIFGERFFVEDHFVATGVGVLSVAVVLGVLELIESSRRFLILRFVSIERFELLKTLREIDMDSAFVDEGSFHFKVGFLARLFSFEFNEGVLQGFTGFPISDNFATCDDTETRKDEFEVAFLSDFVELADEEDILWWLHVSIWDIPEDL